jgi:hypothetical protein
VLRTLGPKKEEVTGDGENYTMRSLIIFLCSYYNSIRTVKSRKKRLVGLVSDKTACSILVGKCRERDYFRNLRADGRIILKI